ncbi:MAG: DNA polymerase I, partial [Kamptonema sp. SIO4C4]|nr:DNA polymerase I [Kamptonema sp. SIO4C4]
PTSATFGFTTTLRSLLEREKPDHIAVAFDGPREDLERTKLYPEYKSTREKAPEELIEQLDDIQRVVQAHGIRIVRSEGQEADDVIGTLAVQGRDAGMDVFIVTGDKDFMQLVDDHLKLWNLRSSTSAPEILGTEAVHEKFGVAPEQMIDMLALMGDSSDNVPGVPRVGQKTAAKLLQAHGSLQGCYEALDEVKPPSIQKALRENRELAELSLLKLALLKIPKNY